MREALGRLAVIGFVALVVACAFHAHGVGPSWISGPEPVEPEPCVIEVVEELPEDHPVWIRYAVEVPCPHPEHHPCWCIEPHHFRPHGLHFHHGGGLE